MAECKECTKARSRDNGARRRADARACRETEAARLKAMSHKVCKQCGEEKPHDEFYADPRRKDGLYPWCKVCRRARSVADAAARRAIHGPRKPQPSQVAKRDALYAIAYFVKSEPCGDCGTAYPPQIMHFHHVDPSQKGDGIAKLIRSYVTTERLREEIAKCVVLCPNCHALRHLREREGG